MSQHADHDSKTFVEQLEWVDLVNQSAGDEYVRFGYIGERYLEVVTGMAKELDRLVAERDTVQENAWQEGVDAAVAAGSRDALINPYG